MAKKDNRMTIGELADAAEVTVRTIRYYVNEGLLPPPEQRGRYALYEPWYLDRLELIKRWKDAYLPLKEIRKRIEPLSNADVQRMLKQPGTQPQIAVAAAMPIMEEAVPWEGEEQQAAAEAPEPEPPVSALDYIHEVQQKKEAPKKAKEDVSAYIRRARRESRRDVRPHPRPKPTPRPSSTGSEWRRIEVFPGLEIHVTEDMSRRYWRELEELMDWISRNFPRPRA